MRFTHTDEQVDFARSLEKLLAGADTVAVARAWAEDDTEPGLALWQRLAEQGLTMLATEATPVELVIAFEALGRHAVPGPWVESAAYLPLALGHEVEGIATTALPPHVPFALDADIADEVYVGTSAATIGDRVHSIDPTRRLFAAEGAGEVDEPAFDLAALATAAQLLGLGERILSDSVEYVKQRRQFGREIGSYQAIKHQLADVRIALDFVRPLVDGAAVAFDAESRSRDVSAAKVAAAVAAYRASRVGLQVHGAIGYTAEFDLSLWLLKVRALVTAWGTPAFHRTRVLEAIT